MLKDSLLLLLSFVIVSCGCDCEEEKAELERIRALSENSVMKVDIPKEPRDPTLPPVESVEVIVTADDQFIFDDDPEQTKMDFENLSEELLSKMKDSDSQNVRISGDDDARYEMIFKLISLCKENEWSPVLSFTE